MPRSDYEQIVQVIRDGEPVLDSYGGEYVTTSTTSEFSASKHFHSAQRLTRAESGPGLQTVTGVFFRFFPPFPTVAVNDRIRDDDGTEWRVQFVRPYARTLQVDVEDVD